MKVIEMKRILWGITVIILAGWITSCKRGGTTYDYNIAVMDSLQISLDEAAQTYNHWNFDSLLLVKVDMSSTLNELTGILKTGKDTITREQGIFLGEYKAASKVFRNIQDSKEKFANEINTSNKQLESLKKDIQNHAISDEKTLKRYISDEKKAVGLLISSLNKANGRITYGMSKYKMMHAEVSQLLDSLKNRNSF